MNGQKPRDRLPPGQNLTRDFPVVHVGSVPHFDPATWELRVTGLVETPLEIPYREFLEMPRAELRADLHCVDTWSVYDRAWSGVRLRDILVRARPGPDAKHVLVHADGGYTTNLPLEDAMGAEVIVADGLNGEQLAPEHGFPARLVVPDRYAFKSAKWVRSFELLAEERLGFWESRGYSNTADPWTEDRFA